MSNKAKKFDAATAKSIGRKYSVNPNDVVIVTDKNHPLYDPDAETPPNEVHEKLALNMLALGQLYAVKVWNDGGTLLVADGRDRTKAARIADAKSRKEGGEGFDLTVEVVKSAEAAQGAYIVGNIRKVDSVLVNVGKLKTYLASGKSEADAAKMFQVSGQTIRNWIAIDGLSVKVKKAIENGSIQAIAAKEFAGLSSIEQSVKLDELLASGAKPTIKNARKVASGEKAAIKAPPMMKRPYVEKQLEAAAADATGFAKGYAQACRYFLGDKAAAYDPAENLENAQA